VKNKGILKDSAVDGFKKVQRLVCEINKVSVHET